MMNYLNKQKQNQLLTKNLNEYPLHTSLIKKTIIKRYTDSKLIRKLPFYKSFLEEPNI